MAPNVYLCVTSAFMLNGGIAKKDDLVEVTDAEARDLLKRGKARVATEEDGVPKPTPAPEAPAPATPPAKK